VGTRADRWIAADRSPLAAARDAAGHGWCATPVVRPACGSPGMRLASRIAGEMSDPEPTVKAVDMVERYLIWPRRVEVIPHPRPGAVHSQPSAGALWYPNSVPMWYGELVPYQKERVAVAISASEARSRLFPLIQQVNDDHVPVRISSKGGDAVLISAEDFDSWQETIYLLRSPANARRLMEAVARDKSGEAAVVKTIEELEALAGE
jgi:antitoxin YefM